MTAKDGRRKPPLPRIDLHKKTFLFPFLCLQFFELLLDLFTFLRMGQQIIGRQGSGPCGNDRGLLLKTYCLKIISIILPSSE